MSHRYYLAIDIGTSATKAVVLSDVGVEVAVASRATPVMAPSTNYSQVDMTQVWRLTYESCAEALSQSGVASDIIAVAITGMGCGLWLVDTDGEPVAPAILWNDGRAADLVGQWQRDGRLKKMFPITGNAFTPGWTVPVMRWQKDCAPEVLARAAHAFCPKDWIRFKLTGDIATDWSDASYVPFDITERRWSNELMELAEIPDLMRLLPPIRSGFDLAGDIHNFIRTELGLPERCVVITGLVDVAASTHGAGAVEVGQACTILGTSCLNSMLFASPRLEPVGIGQMLASVDDLWERSLVNTTGTQNIDWVTRLLYGSTGGSNVVALEREAVQAPVGAHDLIFHPYLSSAGVNSPFYHPAARGNFFGLTAEHTRSDIARAVFEGVTLAILDCYNAMAEQPREVILAGGGNRSSLWCQMIADTLAVPVIVPDGQELGARGVAMLAAVTVDQFTRLEEAARAWVHTSKRYEPQRSGGVLRDRLALYQQIARDLSPRWWERQGLIQARSAVERADT